MENRNDPYDHEAVSGTQRPADDPAAVLARAGLRLIVLPDLTDDVVYVDGNRLLLIEPFLAERLDDVVALARKEGWLE